MARSSQEKGDPLVQPYLSAQTDAERDQHLVQLIENEAAPVLTRVLHGKFRAIKSGEDAQDYEDVLSSARIELVRQLQLLRENNQAAPIQNFRAYCSTVAYNAWAEHLRRMYPARSMLLNRVRYLLENRTNQRGFAMWDEASGDRWCGFEKWRGAPPSVSTLKQQRLSSEPVEAAEEALGRSDFSSMNPAALLAGLFEWLGGPIELRQLIEVMGQLLQISDQRDSLGAEAPAELAASAVAPSPAESMTWQEYLRWLWQNIASLSLPQRTAFLLHSEVAFEFELNGVASIREIAALLELSAKQMSEYWNHIPLPDFVIADLLGKERQQVINLRRVARDRLGTAWKNWSQ